MRRKSKAVVAEGEMPHNQYKRYLALPPPPPKRRKLSRRLGWLKTLAGVVGAFWFASVVIPEKDMEKLMEFLGENFGVSQSASDTVPAVAEPAEG